MHVLSVAEKPSVAKEIAKIIASTSNNTFETKNGNSPYNKIFCVRNCLFRNERVNMSITSVTGHMMEIEFDNIYKGWNSCRPIDLFDAPVVKYVKKDAKNIEKTLIEEAKHAQVLFLWLDCDTEGENICFEVIDVCIKANPRLQIFRAQFSALIPRDIIRTLNNPSVPNKNLSESVEARQEIDLRLGAAFTRLQTLRVQNRFHQLKHIVVSYGTCQFPTLGFVVDRYTKIKAFREEEFWGISCTYEVIDKSEPQGKLIANFSWNRGHVFDKFVCLTLYESLFEDGGNALVTKTDFKPTTKRRPVPLNTIELQKKASTYFRISSDRTMTIAEALYQRGILSYPRTETDFFKEGTDLLQLLEEHRNHAVWGNYVSSLLDNQKFVWPNNGGHDDQSHPPIHPTKNINLNELENEDEKKIYELVSRHFIACCSRDAIGNQTNVTIQIPAITSNTSQSQNYGELFSVTGLIVLERNYLEIYKYESWVGNKIPLFQQGDVFKPKSILMTHGKTAPPHPITESELIAEMDKNNIGTDATIAEHIKTILKREYATKSDSNKFEPTNLGIALVEAYSNMGYKLTNPAIRAEMEVNCRKVARGELNKIRVVKDCLNSMKECFKTVEREISKLDDAIAKHFGINGVNGINVVNFNDYSVVQPIFSKCGVCLGMMDLKAKKIDDPVNEEDVNPMNRKHRILFCNTCFQSHTLPNNGDLRPHELSCKICNFQVLFVKNLETKKEHTICPNCFRNPPAPPDAEDGTIEFRCFQCAKQTCPLAGRLSGGDVDIVACAESNCTGFMRIKKVNKTQYALMCAGSDCKKAFWFPPRVVTQVSAPSIVKCTTCLARGYDIVKLLIHFNIDIGPKSLDPQMLVCPGCSSVWGLLGTASVQLPDLKKIHSTTNFNGQGHNYPTYHENTMKSNATAVISSNYSAALAGQVNIKTVRSKNNDIPSNHATRGLTNMNSENFPMCKCNQPTVSRIVTKESVNKGRQFYCCAKPMGDPSNCKFMQFADEEEKGVSRMNAFPNNSSAPRIVTGISEDVVCFRCKQVGHFASKCHMPPNK